jgi:P27 family predicted phage terminase small subunit
MTMPGPAPKPTAIKKLEGNPGRRPLNPAEPKPRKARPKPPAWLSEAELREWKRITRELRAMQVLTSADADAIAVYCQVAVRYQQATKEIAEKGLTVDSPNGYPIINPALSIVNKCIQQMHRLLTEFGMTPAARSRISVPEPEAADPYEEYKRGK